MEGRDALNIVYTDRFAQRAVDWSQQDMQLFGHQLDIGVINAWEMANRREEQREYEDWTKLKRWMQQGYVPPGETLHTWGPNFHPPNIDLGAAYWPDDKHTDSESLRSLLHHRPSTPQRVKDAMSRQSREPLSEERKLANFKVVLEGQRQTFENDIVNHSFTSRDYWDNVLKRKAMHARDRRFL